MSRLDYSRDLPATCPRPLSIVKADSFTRSQPQHDPLVIHILLAQRLAFPH